MVPVIKNIKSISFIESRMLSHITIIPGVGVTLNYWRDWQELPVVGLSECVVTSSVENKSRLFKTKLTAFLCRHFEVNGRHLSFIITTVDGERFLIGTNEPPYPVVNTEDIMPSRETVRSGCSLTVEYTDTVGLLPIFD